MHSHFNPRVLFGTKNPLQQFGFRADKIESENSETDQLSATGGLDIGGYLLADMA